jgi:hypothetical protein
LGESLQLEIYENQIFYPFHLFCVAFIDHSQSRRRSFNQSQRSAGKRGCRTHCADGFQPESGAKIYSYGIQQDEAARIGNGSPDIVRTNFTRAATKFSRDFPPYSATVIVLSPLHAK